MLVALKLEVALRREGEYTNDRPNQDEQRRIYLAIQQ
jgi:hypothetical protein